MTALAGKSGSGKTSIIKAIRGKVGGDLKYEVNGKLVNRRDFHQHMREQVSFMSQHPVLIDAALDENITLARYSELDDVAKSHLSGCSNAACIELFGVDNSKQEGRQFSGGEVQRDSPSESALP